MVSSDFRIQYSTLYCTSLGQDNHAQGEFDLPVLQMDRTCCQHASEATGSATPGPGNLTKKKTSHLEWKTYRGGVIGGINIETTLAYRNGLDAKFGSSRESLQNFRLLVTNVGMSCLSQSGGTSSGEDCVD